MSLSTIIIGLGLIIAFERLVLISKKDDISFGDDNFTYEDSYLYSKREEEYPEPSEESQRNFKEALKKRGIK